MDRAFHKEGRGAPERGTHDRAIAALANERDGVVSSEELVALGLTPAGIRMRVRTGRLHPRYRGVYAVGHANLTQRGRLRAALLACGAGALIAGRSAASLHGILDDSRAVIDVVGVANRRSRAGIKYHRVRDLHPDDSDAIDGIAVTSLARTLLDVARAVPARRLVYALEQADRMRLLDLRAIRELLDRNRGRQGVRKLREALAALHPEAKYANPGLERRFLAFCRERGIEAPIMNASVCGYTVDALWPRQRVIVELDSWEHHRRKRAFEEDRRRDAKLRLAGYEPPLRVTWEWLTREPDDLELTLKTLLSAPPRRALTA